MSCVPESALLHFETLLVCLSLSVLSCCPAGHMSGLIRALANSMPLAAIQQLSDEEASPLKVSTHVESHAKPKASSKTKPATKKKAEPKATIKDKKAEPNAAIKDKTAEPTLAIKDKKAEPTRAIKDKKPVALKRPAAAPSTPRKKPAAAVPSTAKAYKYRYYKQNKVGFKQDKVEKLTVSCLVGSARFKMCPQFNF